MKIVTVLPSVAVGISIGLSIPASAEFFYISDEGLCDAPGEEHEMQHTIFLTSHEMSNHFFGCNWPQNIGAVLANEGSAVVAASCQNGTGMWQAEFEFAPQTDGYLAVFQNGGGISPVKFYHCPSVEEESE
ncbi:hypothetical protein G5B38_16780 [Pseudohalocynthiibacter aestuariivivens]|nr:hypothetical protein [Pseudohalocynthiibacter aestuariivivens]QIE47046.1 hypothetical protein G5B38_16780 [Pseudohalocynthiibacter aestuariivivens]